MATLEIHDARNQVRRVRISRDQPAMFGSDPMCDVRLEGAGIRPFHGRIRWKARRFKADASPEVPWIEVNGVQVKSKSLYQGDEIRVGACRIFLLSTEDGPDHGEKTVVQEMPAGPGGGRSPGRPAPEFHRMEMAPPSLETPLPPGGPARREGPLKRIKHGRARGEPEGQASRSGSLLDFMRRDGDRSAEMTTYQDKAPAGHGLAGLIPRLDRAPGDDRVYTSPMVIGLVVTFGLLVVFSVVLWRTIARSNAMKQYSVALEDFEAGDFRNAIKDFDVFLASSPEAAKAGKASVLRALARVRQHTGAVGASWGNALKEARAMIDEVGQRPEYRDSSVDLAEDVRKAAEGLADRAREGPDPKALADAEGAVALHARIAGQAAASLLERSRIPDKLARARAAIRKGRDRSEAIAAMEAALKAEKPGDAYSARASLVRRHPDLAADRELVGRLVRANDLIRRGVVFDPSGRPAETEARREPLGPPTSLVLRLDPGRGPEPGGRAGVAYALADGLAFGLDSATGSPLWQQSVGLACPFPPVAVLGDAPAALVVDARSDELTRLDGRTGALAWRQELGGPVVDPPLILGNQVLQPTPDGRLLQIDLASGALRGTLKLGRKPTRTPVADDSAQHLYLLGDEDCLFVLAPDPLACVAVAYVGHGEGSIPCPPARVGRFLVVAENHAIDEGRWRVFVIDEAGVEIKPVQELTVGGWTRATPAASGPVIWSASDRGELVAYSIGLYDAKVPFTAVARLAPGTEPEGPAFPRARSERDFWLASSRSGRFELDLERGKLAPSWTLGEAGPAIGPIQSFDNKLAVLTQENLGAPGVALWGLDPASGQVRWRTVLGAPWPIPLAESASGDALTTIATDGRPIALGLEDLRAGGFVEQPLPKPGAFRLPTSTAQRLEVDGATVIVPEAGAARVLVRSGPGTGEFRAVELPAPLGAPALAWGKDLLIPGADGRAYLIDPKTGMSAADPYVPPFDRSRPIRWRAPVALDNDAVALADSESTLRRLAVVRSPRPRLVATAEVKLDKPLAADPASTGQAVLVATADGRVRSLASRDLGPQGSWPLEAPRLLGPSVVADHAFVADAAGNVVAFAPDGRRLWSARLREGLPAGPPALRDGSAWFLGRDGTAERLALADGSSRGVVKLRCLPTGGPLAAGPGLVAPTGLGTLRLIDATGGEKR